MLAAIHSPSQAGELHIRALIACDVSAVVVALQGGPVPPPGRVTVRQVEARAGARGPGERVVAGAAGDVGDQHHPAVAVDRLAGELDRARVPRVDRIAGERLRLIADQCIGRAQPERDAAEGDLGRGNRPESVS